jgi:DNA-binding ferritin-like protein
MQQIKNVVATDNNDIFILEAITNLEIYKSKIEHDLKVKLFLSLFKTNLSTLINKYCKLLTFQSVISSADMHQTVVSIAVFLFITVKSDASAVFDPLEYQALVRTRFQEMDTILRHQAEQLKELNERIKTLEGVVDNQKTEIRNQNKQVENQRDEINNLTNILENRLDQVRFLQNTIDNHTIQINTLTDQISRVKLKQIVDDTRKSGLQKAMMKEKTGVNKPDSQQNIETRDSDVQMIEDGRKPQLPLSVMDSKGLCFYFDIVIENI